MDKILIALIGVIGTAIMFLIGLLATTVFGGLAGWAVGMFFPAVIDTLREFASQPDLTNFQVGAVLGFVCGFLSKSK